MKKWMNKNNELANEIANDVLMETKRIQKIRRYI